MPNSNSSPCATSNVYLGEGRGLIAIRTRQGSMASGLLMLAGLVISVSAASAQVQRPSVDLSCRPTEQALTFLCTVSAADQAGVAIDGAQITLTADMPSMPMVHNVSPAKAEPVSGQPGKYEGRIQLGMLGEWIVKIRFESPRQDVVVRKLLFEKDKVSTGGTH